MMTRTTASNLAEIKTNLSLLGFRHMSETMDQYLDDLQKGTTDITEFLLRVTETELKAKEERHIQACVKTANFPYLKTLDDYDFSFQPSVNEYQIRGFLDMRFMDNHQNILIIGSPGVGKTHIAAAIGIEAAKNGRSTYFITATDLILQLRKANLENRLEERIKHFAKYRLLIIDEVGYMPISQENAKLFFYLISKRHGKKSTILTSNCEIKDWAEVFCDPVTANAIFDRLADFESFVLSIVGPSYRTRHLVPDENKGI